VRWVAVLAGLVLLFPAAAQPRQQAATVKVAFLQGEQLVLFSRTGSSADGVAAALLKGPTAAERSRDVRTAIPDGTPLRSVTQQGNLVTVDLGEKFSLGTNADSLNARLTQVVLSFTALPGVKYVRILVKGGVPLGLFPGFPTSRPLAAKDLQATLPPPLPPAPGSTGPTTEETRALQQRLADLGFLDASGVDGKAGDQTKAAVLAFQKWARLGRDGTAGPATLEALASAERPTPLTTGSGTRVEVLLDRQLTLLIRDGRVERVLGASTGAPGFETPPGSYTVFRKEDRSWSVPYKVWLPWASYFVGGIAFHESPDVPGYPASHGCVRTPQFDAQWLYRQIPIGTRVTVLARS
jgi:L,D-transpeptidase catalytic domain/Sporulation and spore germination/Putative peptidoglycan binding domain